MHLICQWILIIKTKHYSKKTLDQSTANNYARQAVGLFMHSWINKRIKKSEEKKKLRNVFVYKGNIVLFSFFPKKSFVE